MYYIYMIYIYWRFETQFAGLNMLKYDRIIGNASIRWKVFWMIIIIIGTRVIGKQVRGGFGSGAIFDSEKKVGFLLVCGSTDCPSFWLIVKEMSSCWFQAIFYWTMIGGVFMLWTTIGSFMLSDDRNSEVVSCFNRIRQEYSSDQTRQMCGNFQGFRVQ